MWAIVHYNSSIGDITATILKDKGIIDKIDGVSTLNSIAYALRQSAKFVGNEVVHGTLCMEILTKCIYSIEAPDIGSMMALAQWEGIVTPLLA